MKAVWNNVIIAESADTVIVENNHYFPIESVNPDYLSDSDTTTHCHWKGTANYYHLTVAGEVNQDAVWYYAEPKEAAKAIVGHVAFWNGVVVTH